MKHWIAIACAFFLLAPGSVFAQQSFSCPWGTDAACLDYGATICSGLGKCVDRTAACFDSYQCDYRGFVCASDLSDCAQAHDQILEKNNQLVDNYNALLEEAQGLAAEFDRQKRELDRLQTCVSFASSLEEAQSCP